MLLFAIGKDSQEAETTQIDAVAKESLAEWFNHKMLTLFVPVFSFVEQENTGMGQSLVDSQMGHIMPLYRYYSDNRKAATRMEDRMTIEMILLAEANEEKLYEEESQDNMYREDEHFMDEISPDGETGASLEDLLREENEAAAGLISEFVPGQKQAEVNYDSLQDYETLIKNFYTIDSNTMIGSDQLNVDKLNGKDMTVSKDSAGPQILIYHTHSQETFADSIPGDPSTTIVGVGEYLEQILTEEYGYQVLHHTGQYDVESRDDAYSKALPEIEQLLEENPSIQVVLDLHRDAVSEDRHLVIDMDGRPTAQFMFFNGLSRTRKTGNISYLYNGNLEDNLAFSFQMQVKAAEYYPGLTRKIYLKGYRYNMHLCPKSTLIELGAQNNTVEEAMNACRPLAHILDMVLSGE